MRKMKDSRVEWIGEIPKDWGICRLKNYASIQNGQDYQEVLDDEGAYLVFGSGGPFARAKSTLYNNESVLLGRKGTVDKPLYVNEPFWTVDTMYYTEINPETFGKYFYYLCTQIPFDYFLYGSAVPSMTQRDLNSVRFPRPEKEIQHRIADYLDAKCAQIDRAIARQQEVIEKLKEYKVSVITEAVTKGLNPDVPMKYSGIEWIGEIPEGWEIKKIKHVACILNGDRGSNYPSENDYVDSGVPFIGANALCEDYLDLTDAKFISEEKYNSMGGVKIQFGDILYTLRGSTIGKNAMSTISDGTVASSLMVIRPIRILSIFLYLCLNSHIELQQRRSFINGSTAPNLSAENIGDFRIPYPPISIQEEITLSLKRFIENHSFHIKRLQQTIFKLNDYKKSLIYEVVTGKREV